MNVLALPPFLTFRVSCIALHTPMQLNPVPCGYSIESNEIFKEFPLSVRDILVRLLGYAIFPAQSYGEVCWSPIQPFRPLSLLLFHHSFVPLWLSRSFLLALTFPSFNDANDLMANLLRLGRKKESKGRRKRRLDGAKGRQRGSLLCSFRLTFSTTLSQYSFHFQRQTKAAQV